MSNKKLYQVPQADVMPVAVENTMCQSGGEIPEFGNGGLLGNDLNSIPSMPSVPKLF